MDGISDEAFESAVRWLDSARINYAHGNVDIAVYSLEMSFEIGIKSLLHKIKRDVPKTHSVEDFFVVSLEKSPGIKPETKSGLLSYMEDFRRLLRLRNVAGYVFENKRKRESLKEVYEATIESVESFLGYVENAIKEIDHTP